MRSSGETLYRPAQLKVILTVPSNCRLNLKLRFCRAGTDRLQLNHDVGDGVLESVKEDLNLDADEHKLEMDHGA